MKKSLQTVLFSLIGLSVFGQIGQVDLTLSSGSFSPASVQSSNLLTITCVIKNQGSGASPTSHVRLCISKSNTTTVGQEVWGTDISVESIPPYSNSQPITAKVRIPNSIASGNYYIWILIDNRGTYPYEILEGNEGNNNFPSTSTLLITNTLNRIQNIPYPIIFIHGLNDDGDCWSPLKTTANKGPGYAKMLRDNFGWSSGNYIMKFCLNSVSGQTNTNWINDVQDFTIESQMSKGDYYFVSFDVDPYGNDYNSTQGSTLYESNQAAVAKQGRAIYKAVQHVRNVTGATKVILVGHSMGGLAAREYIQSSYYQYDVAKLFTNGTPHVGTDVVTLGISDCRSEAYRDLRTSYSYTGKPGVYLLGNITTDGYESYSIMSLSSCSNFYNVDVNCNGQAGDHIMGLYYKNLPSDIYYSCAIGTGSNLGGDGCVSVNSADLKNGNTSGIVPDTFKIISPGFSIGTILHQYLPSFQFAEANTRGLDEPNVSSLAYEISPNKLYFGNITKTSNYWNASANKVDQDWYKFTLPSSGILSINVYNIPVTNFNAKIFDQANYSITYNSNGQANISSPPINISQSGPEQYYLALYGEADKYSFWFPYAFSVTFSPATGTGVEEFSNQISDVTNYPNPFKDKTTISFILNESQNVSLKVYNAIGEIVATLSEGKLNAGENNFEFDGTNLNAGLYYYTIQSESFFKSGKMILEK